MILASFKDDPEVCLFVALAALAFCRVQELVRRTGNEPVLMWKDFLWERLGEFNCGLIHVREEVAKSTRRKSSDERFIPLHPRLLQILTVFKDRWTSGDGRVIGCSVRNFRKRLQAIHRKANVPFIDNGWRKSALSYWLAGHKYGASQVSEWVGNSEASCRQWYRKILTPEDGQRWFEQAFVPLF